MSAPGRTERLLTAVALLPVGAKTKGRVTTLRDTLKAVRMIRSLLRGEES